MSPTSNRKCPTQEPVKARPGDAPASPGQAEFDRRLKILDLIARLERAGLPKGKAAELAGISLATRWRWAQRERFAGAAALEPRWALCGRANHRRRLQQGEALARALRAIAARGLQGQEMYKELARNLYHKLPAATLRKISPATPKS